MTNLIIHANKGSNLPNPPKAKSVSWGERLISVILSFFAFLSNLFKTAEKANKVMMTTLMPCGELEDPKSLSEKKVSIVEPLTSEDLEDLEEIESEQKLLYLDFPDPLQMADLNEEDSYKAFLYGITTSHPSFPLPRIAPRLKG